MGFLRLIFTTIGAAVTLAVIAAIAFVWTGRYDVAADSGHDIADSIAEITREKSVERGTQDVVVPPLGNPVLIAEGAKRYDAACTVCHLGPGKPDNAVRRGLNPRPPVLARMRHPDPAQNFWIVKHGIKMTAMPAWGLTYSDQELWAIVAFLQKLPHLSPSQYGDLTKQGRMPLGNDQTIPPTDPDTDYGNPSPYR